MGAGRSKNANLESGPFPIFNPFSLNLGLNSFGPCNLPGGLGLNGLNGLNGLGCGFGLGCGIGNLGSACKSNFNSILH